MGAVENRLRANISGCTSLGEYESADLIQVQEDEFRGIFQASKGGVFKYYHIKEIYDEVTDTYSYTYTEIKNMVDGRIPPNDWRVDDLVYMATENLPKSSSNIYKEDKVDKILTLWKQVISNNLFEVPDDVKNGINYIDINDTELNEEQLAQKKVVTDYIYKLKARNRIEAEVGDIYDLLADTSKRVALLERMLLRLFLDYTGDYPMLDEIKQRYGAYAQPLIEAADAGYAIDRIDLEKDEVAMITRLSERNQLIKDIIKEDYIDKI